MKNLFKKVIMFILCFAGVVALVACDKTPTEEAPAGNFPYDDMIERPEDIPPLAELDYVKYPAKPEGLTLGQGSGMPTVGTATVESEYYQVTQNEESISIKFYEVGRWDYVYLPITNFNKEYQNIKITATAKNVQKVAFTALYGEMYEKNYPAVTTLLSDVGDTEQYYIMQLGNLKLIDDTYNPTEEVLGDQTVFALCLFIDSNPSQTISNKKTDIESSFEITKIEFLKDDDKSLEDTTVEPSVRVGWCDTAYTAEKNEETGEYTINKAKNATFWEAATLDVTNYSSAYSAFNFKFTTTNVKKIAVHVLISGGLADWAEDAKVYEAEVEDGAHEAYIDFSSVQPISTTNWEYVAGYYIKNYKIVGVRIFLDTATEVQSDLVNEDATCVVNELKFDKVVSGDETVISKGWLSGSSSIVLGEDIQVGGIGSFTYAWYSGWEYLTIPVLNYKPANKLTVEFQAADGIDYMGIALGCARFANGGEAVLKSCWDKVDVPAEKANDVAGIVETIEYDATTKIYKITFDFTNAVKLDAFSGKSVNEMEISSLRFYLTDPNGTSFFEGTRTIRFISISFE